MALKKAEIGELRAWMVRRLQRTDESYSDCPITDEPMDTLDEARLIYDAGVNRTIYAMSETLRARMVAAIKRCDDGTFGKCESCAGDIAVARLKAIPYAENCMPCQRMIEGGEDVSPVAADVAGGAGEVDEEDELSPRDVYDERDEDSGGPRLNSRLTF